MAAYMKCRVDSFLMISLMCIFLTCHGQECMLPHYGVAPLTSCIWQFIGNGSQCLANNSSSPECVFNMKFCSAINLTKECGNNVSVCEVPDLRKVGIAGYTAKPFVALKDAKRGFKTVLPLGTTYIYEDKDKKKVSCRLNTTINFICNATVRWPMGPSSTATVAVPVQPEIQFILNGNTCEYNITFDFAGACYHSVTNFPSIPTNHDLSAGSVLVVMFCVFLFAYFVFGSMWNIGFRGARGKEVIPSLDSWTMSPVYEAVNYKFQNRSLFTVKCKEGRTATIGPCREFCEKDELLIETETK